MSDELEDNGFKRHRNSVLCKFWECCQQPLQRGTGLLLVKKVLQSILFRLGLVESCIVEPSFLRLVVRALQRAIYTSDQQLFRMELLLFAAPASCGFFACLNAADKEAIMSTCRTMHGQWSDSLFCRSLCLRTICSTKSVTAPGLV